MIEILLYFILTFLVSFLIILSQSALGFFLFPLVILIVKQKESSVKHGWIFLIIVSLILDTMYVERIGSYGILLLLVSFYISLINFITLLSSPVMKLISVFILYVSYSILHFLVFNNFDFGFLFSQNYNYFFSILIKAIFFVAIYYVISLYLENKGENRIKVK